jgi:hypothetical protein
VFVYTQSFEASGSLNTNGYTKTDLKRIMRMVL